MNKLDYKFFDRDALEVAPQLVGKILVSKLSGEEIRVRITETEAYCGEADTACHAHKGRTKRTEALYCESGTVYVYLCYGMHWLMNVITGGRENPQGVLFRAGEGCEGPARLTKKLGVTGELNLSSFVDNPVIWIEDDGEEHSYHTEKRVGINYVAQEDIDKPWRFVIDS